MRCVLRWDTWTPTDPATLAEAKEREEEEDQKRNKEFEESNPDFCKQMVDDMRTRSEVRRVVKRQTCNEANLRSAGRSSSLAGQRCLQRYAEFLPAQKGA